MAPEKVEGGAYGGVEELYREVIIDHFKAPKNKGRLPDPNAQAEGVNPLCGDQITVTALVEGDKLKDVKFEGHGCAISQSAASMLTEAVKGKSLQNVKGVVKTLKQMLNIDETPAGNGPKPEFDSLGDLVSLEGVKKYPVRIKCAVLSSNTLLQSLEKFLNK